MPLAQHAASVRLDEIELRVLRIPLVAPFTTSFGTMTDREVIVVRARTDAGEGWGEVVTQSAPVYSSEYTQGAWDVTTRWLGPALLQRGTLAPEDVAGVLDPFVGHRMAKAGLELALLDAALRGEGRSFASYLGGTAATIPSGVSVGIQSDPAVLVETVRGYLDEGYVRIKIKIKPGRDIAETDAVRTAFPDIPLQVDANSAYTLADADTLAQLDRFGLLLIEQPLQEDDLVDHAALAQQLKTPVCLDESITSVKAARDALALGATTVINVKAGRVGGYLEALRIADLCASAGIPVWCGGMLETGIGRAANAALAAHAAFTLPGDVSASGRFYDRDIVAEPVVLEDGHVRVPTGPGLGVEVDLDAVEAFTVARATLRA
ncbi:o-succinylbenzoate synthase [Microbacterium aquilitoris]|uniref:o-succinylbenzoate synthase n=1 Tax=Microbacterium aquilitoris TaxID=3067307 RepID=A0ABU3GFD8_9MICO|nr:MULTISPECIES: o-succinylbenzoate synthase [unclassified Microbacterium]MDT3329090.1 o-succinylbenzoate synthase [Microbacterium sp. KSW-18]MDT3344925.1 o-succinylbenzoate synthase [Microbacterium sp. KSW2-22]